MEVLCLLVGLVASIFCLIFWRVVKRIEVEMNYVDLFARTMLYVVGFVSLCLLVFGGVHVLMSLGGR